VDRDHPIRWAWDTWALLRARWDEAAARGTPALITQGGSMSRPILERLGFEAVGHVHMLVDNLAEHAVTD
jgi:hypothetical protein